MTQPDDFRGDELALRLDHHSAFLRSLASRLVRHEADAEDAVQETLAAALTSTSLPAHLAQSRPLAPWLAKVLRRREGHRRRRVAQRPPHTGTEALAERDDRRSSAEDAAATVELSQRLLSAVQGLGEPYSETIVLRFYEGLQPRDIATRMGVPVNTVQTRLSRALELLRTRLDADTVGGRSAWMVAATRLLTDGGAVPSPGPLPAQTSTGGSGSVGTWGTAAKTWSFAAVAAPLMGAGVYGALIQSGGRGSLEAPSEIPAAALRAPEISGAPVSVASKGPSARRTQAAAVGEGAPLGGLVTGAALEPDTLTIRGTIEDLGIDQEPGTGSPAPEGTRVEYSLYYDESAPVRGRDEFTSVRKPGGRPFLELDANGRFELEAPREGLAVVQLFAAGSATRRRVSWKRLRGEIPTGEVEVALHRFPRGSLRGILVDSGGTPMVGVAVSIDSDQDVVETDAEGRFEFAHVDNAVNLRVPGDEYTILRTPEAVRRPRGGWEEVTMVAAAAGRITITCLDEHGEATSARDIFASLAPSEPHADLAGISRFYAQDRNTGPAGVTVIDPVPSGLKLSLDARSLGLPCMGVDANGLGVADEDGNGVNPASPIMVSPGEELAITLRAPRTFRLSGVVRTEAGEPAPGIWVSVRRIEGRKNASGR